MNQPEGFYIYEGENGIKHLAQFRKDCGGWLYMGDGENYYLPLPGTIIAGPFTEEEVIKKIMHPAVP